MSLSQCPKFGRIFLVNPSIVEFLGWWWQLLSGGCYLARIKIGGFCYPDCWLQQTIETRACSQERTYGLQQHFSLNFLVCIKLYILEEGREWHKETHIQIYRDQQPSLFREICLTISITRISVYCVSASDALPHSIFTITQWDSYHWFSIDQDLMGS